MTKETIELRREAVKLITKSSLRGNYESYTTKTTMIAKEKKKQKKKRGVNENNAGVSL